MGTEKRKKLGILQSRGMGDIVISLPIAKHYYDAGWDILWPICEEFVSHFKDTVPWIKWIPIKTDHGPFFYDVPMERLKNFGVDETLCLYQALTGHQEFSQVPWFQYVKFDQYKYAQAGVPFVNKWQLAECITRNPQREQALYDKLITNPKYCVMHLEGSDCRANFDTGTIPAEWDQITITPQTDCLFDWLLILERAETIVCVDSVYANLVDQLGIGTDRYFIPRSNVLLTPVLGQSWTWL